MPVWVPGAPESAQSSHRIRVDKCLSTYQVGVVPVGEYRTAPARISKGWPHAARHPTGSCSQPSSPRPALLLSNPLLRCPASCTVGTHGATPRPIYQSPPNLFPTLWPRLMIRSWARATSNHRSRPEHPRFSRGHQPAPVDIVLTWDRQRSMGTLARKLAPRSASLTPIPGRSMREHFPL